MREDHWVHLYEADTYLGAGFLVTRGFALTALHCLNGLSAPEARLALELPDGRRVPGRRCDADEERDLALLIVENARTHRLPTAPPLDTARPDAAWNCRYRPPRETARLSGRVTYPSVGYQCVKGGELEAMQLQVDQQLGSFAGWSGGPVATGGPAAGADAVVGILLEQQLNRQDIDLGSNVLFAATLAHAFSLFPHLGTTHQRAEVAAVAEGAPAPAVRPRPAAGADERLGRADQFLRHLREWEEGGVIGSELAEEKRSRALDLLIEGLMGDGDDA